jgi:hypothetical protein
MSAQRGIVYLPSKGDEILDRAQCQDYEPRESVREPLISVTGLAESRSWQSPLQRAFCDPAYQQAVMGITAIRRETFYSLLCVD